MKKNKLSLNDSDGGARYSGVSSGVELCLDSFWEHIPEHVKKMMVKDYLVLLEEMGNESFDD